MPITIKEAAKFVLGHSGLSSLTPSELKAVVRAAEEKYKPSLLVDGIENIDHLIDPYKNPEKPIIKEALASAGHIDPLGDEAKALLAALDELRSGALTMMEKA